MGDLCSNTSSSLENLRVFFDADRPGHWNDKEKHEEALLKVRDELLGALRYWSMMTRKPGFWHGFERRLEGLDPFALRVMAAVDELESARQAEHKAHGDGVVCRCSEP